MSFHPVSSSLNAALPKEERQKHGIYFTPRAIRQRLLDLLPEPPTSVLEPSFGSGEFIRDIRERYPDVPVIGVELHKRVFLETAKTFAGTTRIHLTNADFLEYHTDHRASLIIGNPPFFVTTSKNPACVRGRPNIFVLILYKCLTEHLAPNGVLAFVLPTSFYNCTYYEPCRKFIRDNMTILAVESITDADYYDTSQDTMLLVIKNSRPPTPPPYILEAGDSVYINPHAALLTNATAAATTIAAMGCSVKTGEVVWNQHKEKLTDPVAGSTLVLFSNNIVDNTMVIGNPGKNKKQHIKGFNGTPVVGPAIIVARGYGNTTYALRYAVVPAGTQFYGENHVNVITGPPAQIAQIAASLADPRTTDFLQKFVGNGALSKTELESVLPVWV